MTLDILINKGFLNDTREFDQYIAYGTIRGNSNRFTSEEWDHHVNEVVKTAENPFNQCTEKIDEFKQRRFAKKDVTVEDIF